MRQSVGTVTVIDKNQDMNHDTGLQNRNSEQNSHQEKTEIRDSIITSPGKKLIIVLK